MIFDSCIMFGDKLVVPKTLRHNVLRQFYISHLGIEAMLTSLQWIKMSKPDAASVRRACKKLKVQSVNDNSGKNLTVTGRGCKKILTVQYEEECT